MWQPDGCLYRVNEVNTNSSQTLHMELQLPDKAEGSQTQEEIVWLARE